MRYLPLLTIILSLFISLNCSFQTSLLNIINKEKEGKNVIISLLSIWHELSLISNGANGKALVEILVTVENESLDVLN